MYVHTAVLNAIFQAGPSCRLTEIHTAISPSAVRQGIANTLCPNVVRGNAAPILSAGNYKWRKVTTNSKICSIFAQLRFINTDIYMTDNNKPGAERNRWRPDSILAWSIQEETTLLACLEKKLTDHKRSAVKAFLKYRQVAVNSAPITQFDTPLQPGDTVAVNFTRPFVQFSHPRISLVYEDNDIIVINKGSGILSVSTDNKKDGTAYSILRDYLKKKDPKLMLFVVHRLDRDTSGLMMFAKNVEAKEAMQHNWNNMVIGRKYVAVTEGKVEQEAGTIRSYLAETSQFEVYSTQNPEEGQLAVTRYKRLATKNGYSLMELSLDTGRKNQIRVHMKDIGHPIVGDRKYGAKNNPIHRLGLHAQTLHFAHPITKKEMLFETPVPTRFLSLLK